MSLESDRCEKQDATVKISSPVGYFTPLRNEFRAPIESLRLRFSFVLEGTGRLRVGDGTLTVPRYGGKSSLFFNRARSDSDCAKEDQSSS